MKINVPDSAVGHFWENEPLGTTHEFWAFRFPVRAKVGDTIHFYIDKKEVAQAVIDLIEPPGQSSCGTTGKFGNRWKVFWKCESFKDIRK
jgi:hypothetical protein